jgi:hypothetical protein
VQAQDRFVWQIYRWPELLLLSLLLLLLLLAWRPQLQSPLEPLSFVGAAPGALAVFY